MLEAAGWGWDLRSQVHTFRVYLCLPNCTPHCFVPPQELPRMTIGSSPSSVGLWDLSLSKRFEKYANNQEQNRGRAFYFLKLTECHKTRYLVRKHLSRTTLAFALPYLCHYSGIGYCSILNMEQFPKPHTLPNRSKDIWNRISPIAFVPVKHQITVSVLIYCCLWARRGQDRLAVPLRVLKVSQLEMLSKGVIRTSWNTRRTGKAQKINTVQ